MKTQQQKLALKEIDDMVKYYSEDVSRRSEENGICKYLSPNGNKCAVGRRLDDKQLKIAHKNEGMGCYTLFKELQIEKLHGLPYEFWSGLQNLHDTNPYWNEKGLTVDGWQYVESLKKQWT